MDNSDEQFIEQFAALSSGSGPSVQIPQQAVSNRDWTMCALARVVSDRPTMQTQFANNMMRAWNSHTKTTISMVGNNMYLVQFISEQELLRIMHRGVWMHLNDAVVLGRIQGQADIAKPEVRDMEVWMQWHCIPLEAITTEGVVILAQKVGTLLSEVYEVINASGKFYRIKVMVPIEEPLKDKLQVQQPTLGTFTVYLVYERLTTVCLYYAKLGHDHENCASRIRMERLKRDPRFQGRLDMIGITNLLVGTWINNACLIPLPSKATNETNRTQPQPHPLNSTIQTSQRTSPVQAHFNETIGSSIAPQTQPSA